jgi:integral membrane sensor domain MASE1
MSLFDKAQHPVFAHTLAAVMQEYTLGKMTAPQAVDALGIDAAEAATADRLRLAVLNGNPSFAGATPWDRLQEMTRVLLLAAMLGPYRMPEAAVAARLGL